MTRPEPHERIDKDGRRYICCAAAPLDVERLASAMDNLFERKWGIAPSADTVIHGASAEDIADEYARLSEGTDR